MIRFGCRKVILEILIKMGWSRVRLEVRRLQLGGGGGVVGILVGKGIGSKNGVNIVYLKDVKKVKMVGFSD